jgi:hypothetical protein
MTIFDFKPIECSKCGALVWSGVSWAGFSKTLDTGKLTIEEEITKKINGVGTYELHKTTVSFEAVERTLLRITATPPGKVKVILADHHCSDYQLFTSTQTVPSYWQSAPMAHTYTGEGFPF